LKRSQLGKPSRTCPTPGEGVPRGSTGAASAWTWRGPDPQFQADLHLAAPRARCRRAPEVVDRATSPHSMSSKVSWIDRRSENGHARKHTTGGRLRGCPLSRFRKRLHGKVAFLTLRVPARCRRCGKIAGRDDRVRPSYPVLVPEAMGFGDRFESRDLGGDRVVHLAIHLWLRLGTSFVRARFALLASATMCSLLRDLPVDSGVC
jgi:hypothetical protein